MKRLALIALLALALVPATFALQPQVRVIHASPDAPGVDILVNDTILAFENAVFGDITDFAELGAGVYNTKVVPTGAGPSSAVIEADLNLQWFKRYTVIATGTLDDIQPIVLTNDETTLQLPGRARVRFLHASPDAPAVDIKVEDGPYLFQNVAFREVGEYVDVPEATVNVEVYVAGTDALVLTIPALSFEAGNSYTAYAVGFAGGESPSLGALLSVDTGSPFPIEVQIGGGGGDDDDDDEGGNNTQVIEDREDDIEDVFDRIRARFGRNR